MWLKQRQKKIHQKFDCDCMKRANNFRLGRNQPTQGTHGSFGSGTGAIRDRHCCSLRVTMKMEHAKISKSSIRECSVVHLVHILSLIMVLEFKIARSLNTPGLCQPRSCPNHRQVTEAQCLCKCKIPGRLWHWGFYRYLVRGSVRHQPHPYGRSVCSTSSSMSLSTRTVGGHSQEGKKGDSCMVCILKIISK